ncbi:hypothetical protein PMAA_050970, partial [Talaromyces marneffei ATCC 18224]
MHSIKFLLVIIAISTAVAQRQPYSTWMADSMIAIGITPTRYYTQATFYRGAEYVYNKTQESKYFSFSTSQLNIVLTSNGSFIDWDYTSLQLGNIWRHEVQKSRWFHSRSNQSAETHCIWRALAQGSQLSKPDVAGWTVHGRAFLCI